MIKETGIKVILLDNITNLGNIGSEVIVKPGYARNFLIPRSKAIVATKKNLKIFKEQQLMIQSELMRKQKSAQDCAEIINKLNSVTIASKTGIDGKLFGSVGARDIADVITQSSGIKICKSQIRLPNHGILKSVGVYRVNVHIYNEIFAELDVIIVDLLSQQ